MDQVKSMVIWKQYFGEEPIAYDYAAQPMKLEDFENENSKYGWTLDYVKPLSAGGMQANQNLIPCSMLTKKLRDGKMAFKIGNGIFEVRKKKHNTFAIFDVTDLNHPIDRTPGIDSLDSVKVAEYHHKLYGAIHAHNFRLPDVKHIRSKVFSESTEDFDFGEDDALEDIINEVDLSSKPVFVEEQEEKKEEVTAVEKEMPSEEVLETEEKPENVEYPKEDILTDGLDKNATPVDIEVENPFEEEIEEEPKTLPLEEEADTEENDLLLAKIADLTDEKNILEAEKEELQRLYNALRESFEEIKNDLNTAKSALMSKKQENATLEQLKGNLCGEREKLLSDLELVRKEKCQMKHRLDEVYASLEEKDNLAKEAETLKAQLDTLEHEKATLVSEKAALEEQLQTTEKNEAERLMEKDSSLAEKTREVEALQEQLETLKASKGEAEGKATALLMDLESLRGEKQQLENEKELLLKTNEASLLERDQRVDDLQRQVASLNEKLEAQEAVLKGKDETLNESALREKEYLAQIDSLKAEKEEQENKILVIEKAKEEIVASKDAALEEMNRSLEESKQKIQQQSLRLESLEADLASQKSRIENYTDNEKSLHDTITSLNTALLEKEHISLHKNESYDAKIADLENQLDLLKKTNESLVKEKEDLLEEKSRNEEEAKLAGERFDSVCFDKDNLTEENGQLKNQIEELIAQVEELSSWKENNEPELSSLRANKATLENKAAEDSQKLEDYETLVTQLNTEKEETLNKNEKLEQSLTETESKMTMTQEALDASEKEKKSLQMKVVYLDLGGNLDFYDTMVSYLSQQGLALEKDNIQETLFSHPQWMRKEDGQVRDLPEESHIEELGQTDVSYIGKEIKNRKKAYGYWDEIIGEDKDFVTDFAGRAMKRSDFQIEESEYGWDFRVLNPKYEENKNNVVIANIASLADVQEGEFKTNGKAFKIVEGARGFHIVAEDFVTDPYNMSETLEVAKKNAKKTAPLIYIFVKCTSVTENDHDEEKEKIFYDLIDQTAERTCPKSFLEMKIYGGKNGYAFLTFDGSKEGAYKEALNYAVLLNTYRYVMKKKYSNEFNAYIVLNQVEVPFSLRHLNFEQLILASKNVELKALQYDFILTPIINSKINKNLHIGPSIFPELSLDSSVLKESAIGASFSSIYSFNDKYVVYNFIYQTNDNK